MAHRLHALIDDYPEANSGSKEALGETSSKPPPASDRHAKQVGHGSEVEPVPEQRLEAAAGNAAPATSSPAELLASRRASTSGLAAINTQPTASATTAGKLPATAVLSHKFTEPGSAQAQGSPDTTDDANPGRQLGRATAKSESTSTDDSPQQEADRSWRDQLHQTIARLQRELESDSEGNQLEATARLRACLSLLEVVADDREQAMTVLEGLDDSQLEFWRQTVMGLGILLDPDELPKLRHRAESASDHLEKGLSTLATLGPLRLANLAFCTRVGGYGDFEECDAYALKPGQQVLLYVEVENFAIEEHRGSDREQTHLTSSRRGREDAVAAPIYVTDLHARYDILDEKQRTILSRTFRPNRDRSRNRRHDYFIPYYMEIPRDLSTGYYTLELTLEDKIGQKFGSGTIDFRIR